MAKAKAPPYSEKDSPFYKLSTRRKLAELLFVSPTKLRELTRGDDLYYSFQKPKKSGGSRQIDAPRDDLKNVQRRIADLLQRIAPPDFLFAPVAGLSYVDNAARHLGASAFRLLDVEDFFPNCTADRVIWLFRTRLRCPIDVAVALRALVTLDGALPQGSPCSPILAYLCYADMWETLDGLARQYRCTLSIYADDITISGEVVPAILVHRIKDVLRQYRHTHAAKKERSSIHKPVKITGVIVHKGKLAVPNQQHRKLHELRQEIRGSKSTKSRERLETQLRGRNSQLDQILSRNGKSV